MTMLGSTRYGKRKAMLAMYGYAAVTRRCQPVLAYSVNSSPFSSGDLRSLSSGHPSSKASNDEDFITGTGGVNRAAGGDTNSSATVKGGGAIDDTTRNATLEYRKSICTGDGRNRNIFDSQSTNGHAENAEKGNNGAPENRIDGREVSVQGSGNYRGFAQAVKDFIAGGKQLWAELGLAKKAKEKQAAGYALTLDEQRLIRNISRDVYKAFPILAIFAVPIVGYLGPMLGVLYPKVLLPAQFWTWSQRLEYMLQDAREQERSYFPALRRCLAAYGSPPQPNSTRDDLLSAAGWFENEGRLDRLSRVHLRHLIRSCNLIPFTKKVCSGAVPKRVLVSWLSKEAAWISEDDAVLLQRVRTHGCLKLENDTDQREADGQTTTSTAKAELAQRTTLSCQELRVLCWERGLLRCQPGGAAGGKGVGESGGDDDSTLLHRLEVWLSLYSEDDVTRTIGGRVETKSTTFQQRRHVPLSMVLHAPVLLRFS